MDSRTHRNKKNTQPLKVNHFQGLFSWGLNRETNPMTHRDALLIQDAPAKGCVLYHFFIY